MAPGVLEINVLETFTLDQVVEMLRGVQILGPKVDKLGPEKQLYPYRNAKFSLKIVGNGKNGRLKFSDLSPLSLYLLTGTIELGAEISEKLEELGYDPFLLSDTVCGIKYTCRTTEDPENSNKVLMIPPLVEYSKRDQKLVIIDGQHRVTRAKWANRPINVLLAEDVPNNEDEMPIVAFPVGWREVVLDSKLPDKTDGRRKRRYGVDINKVVYKEEYWYFRDFEELGIGTIRAPPRKLDSEKYMNGNGDKK